MGPLSGWLLPPMRRFAFAPFLAFRRWGVPLSLWPSLTKKMDHPSAADWFFGLCSAHGRLVLSWPTSRRWLPTRRFRACAVSYIPVMASPISPLGPPKRSAFASHAAVSRFPILAIRCRGGGPHSQGPGLEKNGPLPAVSSFSVSAQPMGDRC